ncbi:MAG: hypothetical protein QM538_06130 [Methylacidiphilales bacterium]|nr:hypothetical protein [Candidatus Methylacidiphilales bacterium]
MNSNKLTTPLLVLCSALVGYTITFAQDTTSKKIDATAIKPDSLKESRKKDPTAEELEIKVKKYQGPEEYNAQFKKDSTTLKLHENQSHTVQELLLDRATNIQGAVIQQAIKNEKNIKK